MDRREAGVAGASTVAPDPFQVGEEPADAGRVQITDVQRGWSLSGLALNVGQQELERIAVGGDRVAGSS